MKFVSNLSRPVMGLFVVLALATSASAQEASQSEPQPAPPSPEELEEIVVTAPRTREPVPPAPTTVEVIGSKLERIELDASLSLAYTYNLVNPEVRKDGNRGRLVDGDHNTFGIPYARIGLGKSLSGLDELDVGFRIDLAGGRLVQEAYADDGLFGSSSGQPINLPQAYLELQVPSGLGFGPLSVRAGRQASYFGVEGYDPTKNVNFSLSPVATYMPRTLTGLSLGLELAPGLRYTQWVGNGWNKVVDNNDAKSVGGQLAFELADAGLSMSANWILGAERFDSSHDKRWAVELAMGWQVTSSTLLKASVLYGQEQFDDDYAKFSGFVGILKQGFFKVEGEDFHRLSLAVRGSYLSDDGGALTGVDQTLAEVTGTVELRLLAQAALRVEYRHDWSTEHSFLGDSGSSNSRDEQDTIALELNISF